MTDIELKRIEAICEVAGIKDIGELSDGFHTFNSLYEQRRILFAALVKVYRDKAWKSYRHENGEYCFGGGWFIVGIDTPEGSYTYHYENKYWDMFDCIDLPRSPHWDGHTEADAETRIMSLEPELASNSSDDLISRQDAILKMDELYYEDLDLYGAEIPEMFDSDRAIEALENLPSAQKKGKWIPCSERLPEKQTTILVTDFGDVQMAYINDEGRWMDFHGNKLKDVTAWMPLPEPYSGADMR